MATITLYLNLIVANFSGWNKHGDALLIDMMLFAEQHDDKSLHTPALGRSVQSAWRKVHRK
tara:strand:+ start:942 stop:1124 length:183 start_codon:yes stop_codon:yes gene_type:complete